MTRLRAILLVALCFLAQSSVLLAQQEGEWQIEALNEDGWADYDFSTGVATATNGAMFRYGGVVLTAENMSVNTNGDVSANGDVRVQRDDQLWVGANILYNFKTREMEAQEFRTGKAPVFVEGHSLHGETTNRIYFATNSYFTTDDVSKPAIRIRAKRIKIVAGDHIEAHHATLYLADVPVFYFPYYSRPLGSHANNFNFIPGYRSSYGPFLLSTYRWFYSEQLDGALHLDLREKRGVGGGPDFNYHLGRWGDGTLKYYYTYDQDPNAQLTNTLSNNRDRLYFSYLANPYTNVSIRSQVRYQSDLGVLHDFFETEYRQNPQPSTYIEANKFWQNFNLDLYVQPRLNDFLQTVERLPDVRLTGYRQQLWDTPLYYESQSSAGYYRQLFAETNGPPAGLNYEAARADSYHQVLLPETFFGWLNVVPRVGGRFTYYSEASGPGATTDEVYRGIFNTGAEVSFKASRVWPGIQNKTFELDGLRHIVEPSVNYAFVPSPNAVGTNEIPQFDSELPSLRLLPIDFPDYNSIDSINSENVLRLGLHNKLQTKRRGEVVNVADWNLYTDWRLTDQHGQGTFSDVYSDLTLRPFSWLILESLIRCEVPGSFFRMSFHTITFQPSDRWSWTLGQFYLRDQFNSSPTALGPGNNLFTSSLFLKLNENWGVRAVHRYDAQAGLMQEQAYSIYRDLRSWTAALTFRVRNNTTGPQDVGVAFTFSLKAFPRFGLGADTVHPYYLLGR